MGVRDYRELDCWILADRLRRLVLRTTMRSGFAQHRWLSSQLQRAAASACSNIAEGFSRFNPRDFGRFMNMSKGSLSEILEHLESAKELGLITAEEYVTIGDLTRRARAAATRLAAYLRTATPPRVPE